MEIIDRIKGSLVGGAIGDALGYPIEFLKIESIKNKYGNNGITEYELTNGKAIISDDTQMTLFTANGLMYGVTRGRMRGIMGPIESYVYMAYKDWYYIQYKSEEPKDYFFTTWLFDLKELNERRAPGNTCLSALSNSEMGTIEKPINNSKGCGGVMRVAPVGLYFKPSDYMTLDRIGQTSAKISAITHGHPLGIIPAYVLAVLINDITYNEKQTLEEHVNNAMKCFKDNFKIFDNEYNKQFEKLIDKAIRLSKQNINDIDAINELGEGWVAEEALAIAIYSCLKYTSSFEKTVIAAVNHSGDSDSTGAIAGNIIGAYLGYNSIPKHYIDNLELIDEIMEIATDMSRYCPVDEYAENNDKDWLNKYVYRKRI